MGFFTLTNAAIPTSFSLTPIYNDEVFTDSVGGIWTRGRSGNRWSLTLNYQNLDGPRRRAIWATMGQFGGQRNSVYVPFHSVLGYSKAGTGGGSPVLDGAQSAGATQIPIRGAADSPTFMAAGDFIDIGEELKMVVEDVPTSGGVGVVNIWPGLHDNFADGFSISQDSVFGYFHLAEPITMSAAPHPVDDSGTPWINQSLSIQLIEDVYVVS